MNLKIVFTDKEITPWSGMVFMKKLLDQTGILSKLISSDLPEQQSNRGYNPIQLITCFMVSVWCGANRFEHLEVSRFDEVLRNIFGFKRMAGHKAYQRYFKKFTLATNQKVFTKVTQWFFGQVKLDNYTLDVDSTVLTRYGSQEGARDITAGGTPIILCWHLSMSARWLLTSGSGVEMLTRLIIFYLFWKIPSPGWKAS